MAIPRPRSPRTALVTGVCGQDGVYLARLLLAQGYRVVGTTEPGGPSLCRLDPYLSGVQVVPQNLVDTDGFGALLDTLRPDEVYNLGAFSSVGASWGSAALVGELNAMAVLRMLEHLIRFRDAHGWAPRFFQASSSEIFGPTEEQPQTERTPHRPRSPYAAAKNFAHELTASYREVHGLHASNGILYNHESPLRGPSFVTRKITRAAAEIALGMREELVLGNLEVRRDWGAAQDFVRAMWLMLQQDEPGDYVIATGVSHSVAELVETAFASAGLGAAGRYLRSDAAFVRPGEAGELRGDPTLARQRLGWQPTTDFRTVIDQMVRVDLVRARTGVEESADYLDVDRLGDGAGLAVTAPAPAL